VTIPNIYGYTGREFAEEGLYYYRARYMDPRLGRFVAADPLAFFAGENRFTYVFNNPLELVDPFGLDAITADPNIRECMCQLWRKAGYGFYPEERAAWIIDSDGVRSCLIWPWTAQRKRETFGGPIPKGAGGIVHTHPTRHPQTPSSPKPSPEDCKTAMNRNMPVYVVSHEGVYKCEPCGRISLEEKENPTRWCK
jgi:RHS repeat-associated protein